MCVCVCVYNNYDHNILGPDMQTQYLACSRVLW